MNNAATDAPKLSEPGEGISFFEILWLRFFYKPFRLRNLSSNEAIEYLEKNANIFYTELQGIKNKDLTMRILVDRPLFVEDSSRYWSVSMLCRHLAKVNFRISRMIEIGAKAEEKDVPSAKERLTAVKPEADKNIETELEQVRVSVNAIIEQAKKKSQEELKKLSFPHPWLKSLTHIEWIYFAGTHIKIHLNQLEKIKSKLEDRG